MAQPQSTPITAGQRATAFAFAFEQEFCRQSAGKRGEVKLIEALRDTFERLSPMFAVEVFHGSKYQVFFPQQTFPWSRPQPRCELCDLLVVTFRPPPSLLMRMTFLQAKVHHGCDITSPLRANLEQWELLGTRPPIRGVAKKFRPPANLLSDSAFGSIGSFGFFWQPLGTDWELCYHAANHLFPVPSGSSLQARVGRAPNWPHRCGAWQMTHGLEECVSAAGSRLFGWCAYRGAVGAPIHRLPKAPGEAHRNLCRWWLAGTLDRLLAEPGSADEHPHSAALRELLRRDTDRPTEPLVPASGSLNVVVLRAAEDMAPPRG